MEKLNLTNYQLKKGSANEISYWRDETAKLLGKPFKQVCFLTAGWPKELIKDCAVYCAGKPALWWWLYKNGNK